MSAQAVEQPDALHPAIARLRHAGADAFDPVRLHYLGVLAERLAVHSGTTGRLLEARFTKAVADFDNRFEQFQRDADAAAQSTTHRHPQSTGLADLTRQLTQHNDAPSSGNAGRTDGAPGVRTELKAVSQFRNTWSKLSADKQLAHALGQAPKNAGPINSHRVVLRSLSLMRELSPDYLNRFMAYADTLLCLDHTDRPQPKAKPRRTPARPSSP